ncbi:alpha/beta fold hydrolase, partial [Rubricoccus marinus]
QDRVCFPSQAERATARFPGARLEWLDRCGHFPQWDRPEAAVRLILAATGDAATGDAATGDAATGTTEARGVQSPAAGPDSAA